ncbi:MAG: biopolymer transporter ExbD [Pseudoxanthomonas sp.]
MAFSSGGGKGAMSEINVTPLIDVMLVLLIIFIVTAPIMTYPIDVALPQRVINPPPETQEPPDPIDVRIDASNTVYWNDGPVSVDALPQMMTEVVQKDPTNQPQLRIDSNPDSQYETTARVLAAAKQAGMLKIGFVNQ